jgi:hypothetical protein
MSTETILAYNSVGCFSSLEILPTLLGSSIEEDACLKLCDEQLFSYCSYRRYSCKGSNEPKFEELERIRDGRCLEEDTGATIFTIGTGAERLRYLSNGPVNREELNQSLMESTLFQYEGCAKPHETAAESNFLKYQGSLGNDCFNRCARIDAKFCAIENGSRGCWASWSPAQFDDFLEDHGVDESECNAPCRFPDSLNNVKCGGMARYSIYSMGEGSTIFNLPGPTGSASATGPTGSASSKDAKDTGVFVKPEDGKLYVKNQTDYTGADTSDKGLSTAAIVAISLSIPLFLAILLALFITRRRANRGAFKGAEDVFYEGKEMYAPPAMIISQSLPLERGNNSLTRLQIDSGAPVISRRRSSDSPGIRIRSQPPTPIVAPFAFKKF